MPAPAKPNNGQEPQTHADGPASQWLFGRTQLAVEEGVVVAIRHLP